MGKKNRCQIHEGHPMTFIFNTPKKGLKHSTVALRASGEHTRIGGKKTKGAAVQLWNEEVSGLRCLKLLFEHFF